ncbi:hypothetical protein ACJRO7_016052 [Eucalyptus globulus]|uniref:Uncharacterized protein n=1 Tax=Eucalyptus globulus TaxID=34317 RepID=A0ABD3L6N9_EUCGL
MVGRAESTWRRLPSSTRKARDPPPSVLTTPDPTRRILHAIQPPSFIDKTRARARAATAVPSPFRTEHPVGSPSPSPDTEKEGKGKARAPAHVRTKRYEKNIIGPVTTGHPPLSSLPRLSPALSP